ncbi:hypothetical protein L7F22_017469 [Adiantum nelumboides]|nr:hypothetical protein [Adiantum nelumboides]
MHQKGNVVGRQQTESDALLSPPVCGSQEWTEQLCTEFVHDHTIRAIQTWTGCLPEFLMMQPFVQSVGAVQSLDTNASFCLPIVFSIEATYPLLRTMRGRSSSVVAALGCTLDYYASWYRGVDTFHVGQLLRSMPLDIDALPLEVDAVVADLTINAERLQKVAFTVPYLASSLVMVTPFRYGSAGALWDFLKPFSKHLWFTLLGCFAMTGIALYLLEDRNPDFAKTSMKRDGGSSHGGTASQQHQETLSAEVVASNPTPPPPHSHLSQRPPPTRTPQNASPPSLESHDNPPDILPDADISSLQRPGPPIYDQASHKHRIMNAYWFTSLCLFQAQQESVRTHLGRIVTVTWLFVMLIFTSSYTASLASLLSAQKRYPTIDGFQALLRDENISVGYQQGSFMETYMHKLHLETHRLINFTSETDCARQLRDGDHKPDGVGAVLDELPYIQILLQTECDFTQSSRDNDHLPAFGGFAFAFRKGDPLVDQFSKVMLEMAEDGTLKTLQNGWKIGEDRTGRCDSNTEPSHLRLRSFGGLFSIVVSVYVTCIIWRLTTKAIKSPENSCMQTLPCTQHGSTIGQTGELSLSRHSNRVHEGDPDDQIS